MKNCQLPADIIPAAQQHLNQHREMLCNVEKSMFAKSSE